MTLSFCRDFLQILLQPLQCGLMFSYEVEVEVRDLGFARPTRVSALCKEI